MEFNDLARRDMTYSVETEQTVLGALLIEPERIGDTLEYINRDYFYLDNHKALFDILVSCFTVGDKADLITVLNTAVQKGVFENESTGKQYLMNIMSNVPSVNNLEDYCKIIREKYYIRSLLQATREIASAASDGQESASSLLDLAEQKIYDIRKGRETQGLKKISEVVMTAFDNISKLSGAEREKYIGAKSGFVDLDNVLTGLNKSDLIILAARPGMGKTAFALNIAANVCNDPEKQVAIFSLEMSNEQLATRMMSSESRVPSYKLKTGYLDDEEWKNLSMGAGVLSNKQIYLDDTPGISVPQIKAKLRRMKGLSLVIIDYLQLMSSGRRIDNRVQEVSEITRQLKLMAKELNVPVITLSQLARGPEGRTDKRPMLSDLRESGSIEQDADIVLFLYRDAYYNKESPQQNLSECIVAKNRHGETRTVNLIWDGQFTRFSSADNIEHPGGMPE